MEEGARRCDGNEHVTAVTDGMFKKNCGKDYEHMSENLFCSFCQRFYEVNDAELSTQIQRLDSPSRSRQKSKHTL